ncbi:MAG: hypothetical protein ACREX8_04025, partial [Gammaproteobacteria bacterium]
LKAYLQAQGGAAPAGSAISAARGDGISRQRVMRARIANGVTTRRAPHGNGWLWALEPPT